MGKKDSSIERIKQSRYSEILARIFQRHYRDGLRSFEFERSELIDAAAKLKIALPKNIGDLIYSFRFRTPMPASILETQPIGFEWIIQLAGTGTYRMNLRKANRIVPSEGSFRIKIPDATPEIVASNTKTDEQALLAKVRYNRLIDIFLGVTAYSLQNHLRTSVAGIGQIEVDELYIAVNKNGQQFVIPVQAKGGKDKIGIVQIEQDLALCAGAFPKLTPRPVAVQFVHDERGESIVMFEFAESDGEILKVDEKHYCLVQASEIGDDDRRQSRLN